jgi:DNA end-binding protein Ku
MLLTTLHWPDEIRSLEELNLPEDELEIKPAERKMAEQLIASMEGEFDPATYRDEYREALMAVIEAKVAGEAPKPAKKVEPTKIGDLMAALEASVAAARDARREGAAEGGAKPAAKARAKPAAARKPAARKAKATEEAAPARRRKTA